MDHILNGLTQAIQLLILGDAETYSAAAATLKVSTGSMIASLLIGIPAGFLLGHHDFPGKKPVRTLVDTLTSLPWPFLVYALLTRRGPLGHLGLLFTLKGVAIGQTLLALPVVIAMTAACIESMDEKLWGKDLEDGRMFRVSVPPSPSPLHRKLPAK